MKIILIIITLIFIILTATTLLGIIHPKLILIRYFKNKERDFFFLPCLFCVIIFSLYLNYYNKYITNYIDEATKYDFQSKKNNITHNNYLTNIDSFIKRYNILSKNLSIFDINKDLMNEIDGMKSILLTSNFKINFATNEKNEVTKINIITTYKNDIKNKNKYIESLLAIICSTDNKLDYERSSKLYQTFIKKSLNNKQSNIHFGKYKSDNILYSVAHIPNEYFNLEIEAN